MIVDDFVYNNEEESEMGQLHAIHNNFNHIAKVRRLIAEQARKPSAEICVECDEIIPKQRRIAVLGVQHCVGCQELLER